MLPFTVEEFLGVFTAYNQGVWPMQIVLYAIALAALFLTVYSLPGSGRAVSLVLALFWLWIAIAYHVVFFARLTGAAWLFGALSLTGGLWLVWIGAVKGRLRFRSARNGRGAVGALLIAYALIGYPIAGYLVGHRYPAVPTFGAPCPITIFTLGMLLLAAPPVPRSVFLVPAIWAAIGGLSATFLLGVYQDGGLLVAGVIAIAVMILPAANAQATALERAA